MFPHPVKIYKSSFKKCSLSTTRQRQRIGKSDFSVSDVVRPRFINQIMSSEDKISKGLSTGS